MNGSFEPNRALCGHRKDDAFCDSPDWAEHCPPLPRLDVSKPASNADRGIGFKSPIEQCDTTTPGDMPNVCVFGALAEFERDLIRDCYRVRLAVRYWAGRTPPERVRRSWERAGIVADSLRAASCSAASGSSPTSPAWRICRMAASCRSGGEKRSRAGRGVARPFRDRPGPLDVAPR